MVSPAVFKVNEYMINHNVVGMMIYFYLQMKIQCSN